MCGNLVGLNQRTRKKWKSRNFFAVGKVIMTHSFHIPRFRERRRFRFNCCILTLERDAGFLDLVIYDT